MHQLIFTLLFCCLVHSIPLSALKDTEIINTTYGPVRGKIVEEVKVFRSIPFAAPPVGDLRFAPPVAPQPWNTVKDCFDQQSICSQFREGKEIIGKEDCLFLDVYVPEKAQGPLPVMFFIYGGGWVFGDSWEMGLYDGKNLAKSKTVVVVTVNYRLNAFGFLGLNELKKESPDGTTGNYGIQDQRFALYWVQDNIKKFGGDPDRVLLFGESAGAFSTCVHLVSPLSVRNGKKLFHAALLESGNCEANEFYLTMDETDSFSVDYAAAVGCNRTQINNDQNFLACLRHLSEGGMMEGFASWFNGKWPLPGPGYRPLLGPVMPWGVALDGSPSGLLGRPLELVQSGKWIQVPTIMGTNHNEGDIFLVGIPLIVPGGALPITDKIFNLTLLHFFGGNQTLVDQVAETYPKYQFKNDDARVSVILRDMFFVCSTRRLLRAVAANGVDAYMYHFTYQGDWIEDPILGDYHSSELEYVFHNPWPPLVHAFSKKDKEMADTFGSYWSSMAYFATPNGLGVSYQNWPKYNQTADMNIVLNVPTTLQSRLYSGQCDFWDTIPPQFR